MDQKERQRKSEIFLVVFKVLVCEKQVLAQVHGDLPLPLHERAATLGAHLHHLQVRICSRLPETKGQKMPLSLWLPRHRDANKGQEKY